MGQMRHQGWRTTSGGKCLYVVAARKQCHAARLYTNGSGWGVGPPRSRYISVVVRNSAPQPTHDTHPPNWTFPPSRHLVPPDTRRAPPLKSTISRHLPPRFSLTVRSLLRELRVRFCDFDNNMLWRAIEIVELLLYYRAIKARVKRLSEQLCY